MGDKEALKFSLTGLSTKDYEELQNTLFREGYSWASRNTNIFVFVPKYLFSGEDGILMWSNDTSYFDTLNYRHTDALDYIKRNAVKPKSKANKHLVDIFGKLYLRSDVERVLESIDEYDIDS